MMNASIFSALPDAIAAILLSFLASEPHVPEGAAPTAKFSALETFEQVVATIGESERYWSAPYILADLETREVYVWSEHTGMLSGDPLEFFVIAENSGHDYEALMVSFARPSDIHTALTKIGLSPGGPVDPDRHRFWPRGDRVSASIFYQDAEQNMPMKIPVEATCEWKGKPMPPLPWVFTGSPLLPSRGPSDDMVYAADDYAPNSIASLFNLRATVFDLPLQGSKTGVYGNFIFTPKGPSTDGHPLILHLKAADPSSYPTEMDLSLTVSPDGIALKGSGEEFSGDLADVGSFLNQRENETHFVTVSFADGLSLSEATQRAQEIQLLEKHVESLRIEPPPTGQVFFRAFVPDPRFRIRENRPSQPLELHINKEDTFLVELEEKWTGASRTPEVTETQVPLKTPHDLVRYVQENPDRPPVLFVYAPEDLPLGNMRVWTKPILDEFPVVFVYKK